MRDEDEISVDRQPDNASNVPKVQPAATRKANHHDRTRPRLGCNP